MAVQSTGGPREFASSDDLVSQVKEYASIKSIVDSHAVRQKELKAFLFEKIDSEGETDDKGHIWLELPEPVDEYVSLQKERRVSRKIDEGVAETIIESKGLAERLFKTIRVVDEDELMAALYDGTLTEEEVDEMFPSNVVWALKLSKK